ncbi:MAG: glycerophosphodiester phosphodiesterase family protein [Pseudomonadota bacterium]|nr:glycerophosphodiester phosphodiesterase family protein [Pseudomonadota bacterium]
MEFAHRGGAESDICENTLQAFKAAFDVGFRNFELDIRASSDGYVFVCHDNNLKRLLDQNLYLSRLRARDIRKLRLYGNQSIPLLSEVLEEFPEAQLNIDAKAWSVVNPLCKVISATHSYDRICITSFNDFRTNLIVRKLDQPVCFGLGVYGVSYLYLNFLLNRKQRFKAGCVQLPTQSLGIELLTPEFIRFAQECDLRVHAWTINDRDTINQLIKAGVDGIMTDRCNLLKSVLTEQGIWQQSF